MHMLMETLAIANLQVLLWLHSAEDPTQQEWDEALAVITKLIKQERLNVANLRCLVVTDGGAPNSKQRHQLNVDLMQKKPLLSSAFSVELNNPLKRGVATAIHWLNPAFQAFAPSDWRQGLTACQLLDHADQVLGVFQQMQKRLPAINKTLAAMLANQQQTST